MESNIKQFKQQLDEAVELVEGSGLLSKLGKAHIANTICDTRRLDSNLSNLADSFIASESLLSRCDSIRKKHSNTKPTIRVLHHLACTGGTLISKCISALPNVFLLSEAHPNNPNLRFSSPIYSPSDITKLAYYSGVPKHSELADEIFNSSIDKLYEHVEKLGGVLVIREHTHSDYNTEAAMPAKSKVVDLLEARYEVKSVLDYEGTVSKLCFFKKEWLDTFQTANIRRNIVDE